MSPFSNYTIRYSPVDKVDYPKNSEIPDDHKLSAIGKSVTTRVAKIALFFSRKTEQQKKSFYITKAFEHLKHVNEAFIKDTFRMSSVPSYIIPQHYRLDVDEASHLNEVFALSTKNSAFKKELETELLQKPFVKREAQSLVEKAKLFLDLEKELNKLPGIEIPEMDSQKLKGLNTEELKVNQAKIDKVQTAKSQILKHVLKINLIPLSKVEEIRLKQAIKRLDEDLKNKTFSEYTEILKDPSAFKEKMSAKEKAAVENEINQKSEKFQSLYKARYPQIIPDEWHKFNALTTRGKIENLAGERLKLNSLSPEIKDQFSGKMEEIYNQAGTGDKGLEAMASAITKYIRCHDELKEYDKELVGDKQHLFLLQLPFKKGISIEFDAKFKELYGTYKKYGAALTESLQKQVEKDLQKIKAEVSQNISPEHQQQMSQLLPKAHLSDVTEFLRIKDIKSQANKMYEFVKTSIAYRPSSNTQKLAEELTLETLEGYEQAAVALRYVIENSNDSKNVVSTQPDNNDSNTAISQVDADTSQVDNNQKNSSPNKTSVKEISKKLKQFFWGTVPKTSSASSPTIEAVKRYIPNAIDLTKASKGLKKASKAVKKKVFHKKEWSTSEVNQAYKDYAAVKREGSVSESKQKDLTDFANEFKKPETGLELICGLCKAYSGIELSAEQKTALKDHTSLFALPALPTKITDNLKYISPGLNIFKNNHTAIVNLINGITTDFTEQAREAQLKPGNSENLFISIFEGGISARIAKAREKAAEEESAALSDISEGSLSDETGSTASITSDDSDATASILGDTVEIGKQTSSNKAVESNDVTDKGADITTKSEKEIKKTNPKLFPMLKIGKVNITPERLKNAGRLVGVVLNYFRSSVTSVLLNGIKYAAYPDPKIYWGEPMPSDQDIRDMDEDQLIRYYNTMNQLLATEGVLIPFSFDNLEELANDLIIVKDKFIKLNSTKMPSNFDLMWLSVDEIEKKLLTINALLPEGQKVEPVSNSKFQMVIALSSAIEKVKRPTREKRDAFALAIKPLIKTILNKFLDTHKTKDLFEKLIPVYTKLVEVDCEDVEKQKELYSALAGFTVYTLEEIFKEKDLVENVFNLLEDMYRKNGVK